MDNDDDGEDGTATMMANIKRTELKARSEITFIRKLKKGALPGSVEMWGNDWEPESSTIPLGPPNKA